MLRFALKTGGTVASSKTLANTAEKLIETFIEKCPVTTDFDSVRHALSLIIKRHLPLHLQSIVQITGDEKFNAYIDVYIIPAKKDNWKPGCASSRLHLQPLWRTYNDQLTKIYEQRHFPSSDTSGGHKRSLESFMQKVQNRVIVFCRKHPDELAVISKCDVNPKRRAIANTFLRFIDNKKGIKLLLKATRDYDHFAHNMAWQSLLTKLEIFKDSENAFMIPTILSKAYKLLAHPSTICKNKALQVILYFLENNLLPKKIPSRVRVIVREASNFKNPIIHEPAGSIIKLCR